MTQRRATRFAFEGERTFFLEALGQQAVGASIRVVWLAFDDLGTDMSAWTTYGDVALE